MNSKNNEEKNTDWMNIPDWIAGVMVVLMGINAGVLGTWGLNIIAHFLGIGTLTWSIYSAVGVASVWLIISTAIKVIRRE